MSSLASSASGLISASGPAGTATAIALWGGLECTVNRLRGRYFSQIHRSGHYRRMADLERIAELGIRTVRYPILWELTAPSARVPPDWYWARQRLEQLRELDITPIVGLLHHGSVPRHTSLVEPGFPERLAAYAGQIAERFPWLEWYTPVNEPLTTARFSGLYGHWYPHGRSAKTFVRALLQQCQGTVRAMAAIRSVNPHARLVQTDDLGRIYSSPSLAYQAEFENERRWLSWDLLCGKVTADHPLHAYLVHAGITDAELDWFLEHPCPPDIIGINHYLTSNRYLDDRLGLYPREALGGNGRDRYADVEAVRVLSRPPAGFATLLGEAWARYRIPLALTEVHLGCTREEQLRWLCEAWNAAERARQAGADVRAVAAWALFGAYDWNSLLTQVSDYYESGAFDLRASVPRPTAVAHLLKELAAGRTPVHPVLDVPGWWRRPERLLHPLEAVSASCPAAATESGPASGSPFIHTRPPRPLLITGANGTLGQAFARICALRGLAYHLCNRAELDICAAHSARAVLARVAPWAVVNTAGYVQVDAAETEPARCYRENSLGPKILAQICDERDLPFLTFSTDQVFDGQCSQPYVESQPVRPLNVYGLSKAEAENSVLECHPRALVVRTGNFFGPWDQHNFLTHALQTLAQGRSMLLADDVIVSPTYIPDLVHACLDLLIDGESGLWHLVNQGSVSWAEVAMQGAGLAKIDARRLQTCSWRSLGSAARRPRYSVLTSERGVLLPFLGDALSRYAGAVQPRLGRV